MVKKSVGIRGFVGESIVEQWLKRKYPNCEIVSQIKPISCPNNGGPYLDFGVLKNGEIVAIYEVKTQDYAIDTLNKAFRYIENEKEGFLIQGEKRTYPKNKIFKTYLILLREPSKKCKILKYIKIIYFEGLGKINRPQIKKDMDRALNEEIGFLNPKP